MLAIEINELKKIYGKSKGIENITFNVKEGEIFGFIGPNGAGKSTTIRSLMGLIKPTSGSIHVAGLDCVRQGHLARKLIGYMPSEVSLYPKMTCREILKFACDMKGVGYERIDGLATRFELPISKKSRELSFGNKKKLMIIAALVSSPSIIILDEPTTGLDPLMQTVFYDVMREEQARGATVLLSSHVLSEVQRICDRVAIVKAGKIVSIEKIGDFKDKYLKIVSFRTRYSSPSINLVGIANYNEVAGLISFQYRGDMNNLIKYLASLDIEDVQIQDADLESIFMHYYQ